MKKTKLELVAAAKELNELFGLSPEIETGEAVSIEELEKSLLKAGKLAEPDDEISEKTLEILELLTKQKEQNQLTKKEVNTKKSAPGKVKEPTPGKVKEPTPGKVKEPTSTNTGKITKKRVIEEMINSQKGATIEQMAQAIVDKKIDPDFKKNCLIVKLWLGKMGFGVKKQDIEKNPIFKK